MVVDEVLSARISMDELDRLVAIKAAAQAYVVSVNGDPEKDIWDTGSGEYEEGAEKTSSDWAWKAYDDRKQAAFDGLRAALGQTPED
jgi:hypothetical protein